MNDGLIKRQDAITAYCEHECGIKGMTRKNCGETDCGTIFDDIPAADVVEADKAQKEIDYWHDKAQSYEQTILKLALNTADVVEVVRCKDCEYYNAEWDMFEQITTAWFGKQCYFLQDNYIVYSRLSCKTIPFSEAIHEFIKAIE